MSSTAGSGRRSPQVTVLAQEVSRLPGLLGGEFDNSLSSRGGISQLFWAVALAVVYSMCAMGTRAAAVAGSDVVVLKDGERLEGSVLNQSFEFRTPYAKLVLKKGWLSEINLNDNGGGLHSIVTVNGDLFSGLLADRSLTLAPIAGEKMEIRREIVTRVSFKPPANDTKTSVRQCPWVQLRNGDRFSGELSLDKLRLKTDAGWVDVKMADLSELGFSSTNPSLATVWLRDDRTLQGPLDTEDLEFRLEVGLRMQIHQQLIQRIVYTEGPQKFSASPGNVAAAAPIITLEGLVWIPPGRFLMGSPPEETGRDPDEGPQTEVLIKKGFWIGRFEVSQAQFQEVMGSNPSQATGDPARPVEKVTWFEAMEYCEKLNRLEESRGRLPQGLSFRLPTEAEWEYVCRAGTLTRFSYGDDRNETELAEFGWFARNGDSVTHAVGLKRPNPWGLHDMHGNVWEWCLDRWESKYPGGSVTNSPITAKGNLRVARGGSWLYEAKACRCANRDEYSPGNRCSDVGFRVVLAPVAP